MRGLLNIFVGCFLLIFVYGSLSQGYAQGTASGSLRFVVSLEGKACLGKPLGLRGTVTNMGTASRVIDPLGIWMAYTANAYDRVRGEYNLLGARVPIVDTYHWIGRPYGISLRKYRERLVTLHPGESTSAVKTFDPSCEKFFFTPGRYGVSSTYDPELADPDGFGDLKAEVEAEEVLFSINRCD